MQPTRIYLSGCCRRQQEFLGYARQLDARGYEVVSRWLWDTIPLDPEGRSMILNGPERMARASRNVYDIRHQAQAFLSFVEPNGEGRGGRHFELGQAYQRCHSVYLVGELGCQEHLYHSLDLLRAASFEALLPRFPDIRLWNSIQKDWEKGPFYDSAIFMIEEERRRQRDQLGYSLTHDRIAYGGTKQLEQAAWCYIDAEGEAPVPDLWPWEPKHWKPTTRSRNLVKAAALAWGQEDLDRGTNLSYYCKAHAVALDLLAVELHRIACERDGVCP